MMQKPKRFYSLDVLRGIASLSVVVWHWQNFFAFEVKEGNFRVDRQPFFEGLFLFYKQGAIAVDLFFCLSGFVFYWLYAEAISSSSPQEIAVKPITLKKFAIRRFARLYPLHLITLLAVVLIQIALPNSPQALAFYRNNDLYHLFLNLFLLNSWGFEKGYSFNTPVWSISVEVLLYGLFFALCRLLPVRLIYLLGMAVFGLVVERSLSIEIGRGLLAFFLGGCTFLIYDRIVKVESIHSVVQVLPHLTIIFWIVTIVAIREDWMTDYTFPLRPFFKSGLLLFLRIVLIPLSILSLVTLETVKGKLGRPWAMLGNISYSVYLLHFPLQLVVMGTITTFSINRQVLLSPLSFLCFFAVLIPLSLVSYRYFEMPAQKFLRQYFST
jgi:peptidoglycan/LPS O-acetylase OafA/YrhL